jgi:hypothetical protein
MKRRRLLLPTFIAATLGLTFSACEKKPADTPKPPQAGEASTPATAPDAGRTASVPITPAKQPATAPTPVTPAEVAKISAAYGFVARLPKDVEGFGASYRLHDLWTGLANSKWAATLLDLPPIKANPDITKVREQWNSEQGQQAREMLQAFFGNELTVAMPAGFTAKLGPWVELFSAYQQTILQAYFMVGMSGGAPDPSKMQQIIKDAAPEFIPILARCELPPFFIAFKAAQVRPMVDGMLKQFTQMIGTELPPAFEPGQFKVSDKYEFQSISVNAKKLVAQFQEVKLELQLKELLGDEAKAKEALDALVGKRVEVAWGWVDDYLVVAFGSDHNHVKLAASEADSALTIPDVAKRGSQFAGQKLHGLSYVGKGMFEALQGKISFAEQFKTFAEELQGILKPEQIEAMVADARRLEAKAQTLFANTFDPAVQVDLWDGGLRSEIFGGARNKALDCSKPLTFAGLAGASTLLLADGRANGAYTKATADFVEDVAATLWSWYEKYGRTMVPESERQGAAMIEATAKPMLVDFWRSSRKLGQGLGDESALVVDLAGPMPKLPDVPPFLAEAKVPRIAWISELKDRAAISEAWKGYSSLIKQIAALADQAQAIPEPQMKQEGTAEIHFVPLPMPTDDFLPHVAITKDRWMLSTAPSFTKEIIGKAVAPAGNPLGSHWNLNFTALWDYADGWLKLMDKNGADVLGPGNAQYQEARPLLDVALKLGRSVQGFEWHVHEESGLSRNSVRLKLQDLR